MFPQCLYKLLIKFYEGAKALERLIKFGLEFVKHGGSPRNVINFNISIFWDGSLYNTIYQKSKTKRHTNLVITTKFNMSYIYIFLLLIFSNKLPVCVCVYNHKASSVSSHLNHTSFFYFRMLTLYIINITLSSINLNDLAKTHISCQVLLIYFLNYYIFFFLIN